MDLVVRTERIPAPGETVLGGVFFQLPGGKGANQAVAAARLGGAVTFVGCVGEDAFGDSLLAGLKSDGVDTSFVRRIGDTASGVALIGVDAQGQNSIIVAPGANAALNVVDIEAARSAIESADAIVAQFEVPQDAVIRAMHLAVLEGVHTILNPAPFHFGDRLSMALLSSIEVLVPNEHEAAAILGVQPGKRIDYREAAVSLLRFGPGSVIITLGNEGCIVADKHGVRAIPADEVDAVDTTAAGDCFCGALAVALAEGLSLDDAARFASAAAAISVTRMGAQPSMPMRGEVVGYQTGRRENGETG
jgi:ribokinase